MGVSKQLAKGSVVTLSRFIELSNLMRLVRPGVYAVNYHSIAGADADPYINENVYRTAEEFENDIKFFLKNFRILSMVELIQFVKSNTPPPSNALVITFDDGLRINYDIQIPILKKHGVIASFFLTSAFINNADLHHGRKLNLLLQKIRGSRDDTVNRRVKEYMEDNNILHGDIEYSLGRIGYRERHHLEQLAGLVDVDFTNYLTKQRPYLSYNQIDEMLKDGFEVGAHSIDHPRYTQLSLEEQVQQTTESLDHVVSRFGLSYRLFAFPYSDDLLSSQFFDQIRPHVDLTFGMGGFVHDSVGFSIQRSEVESTQLPIELALKYRLLTSGLKSLMTSRGNFRKH